MNLDVILGIVLRLLAVAALVLLNGFFVAAEFGLVKIRETQLMPLIRKGQRRAKMARHIIKRLDEYLSAAQLGITLASLGLGWIGEPVFSAILKPLMEAAQIQSEHWRHTIAFIVGFSIITFLHISAGEQAPKWLAIQKPAPTALWVSVPLHWFYRLAYPFIWVLNHTALWLLRRIGIRPEQEADLVHSEEELRLLFATSQKAAGKVPQRRDIVLNALDLRHRIARDVMRPRQEIVALNTEANLAECFDVVERTRFSRFPLCEAGDLDKILGVVHIKDMYALRFRAHRGADFLPKARKLVYVPETARLEKLLQLLLERKLHLAMVVDEYGGTVGMLTLEDILEELVDEIQDEFDQEEPLLVRADETTWELVGTLPVRDLAELVGEPLEEEGITTTSGWITHRLGGFPKVGDTLQLGNFELRVEETDDTRVTRLRLTRNRQEAPTQM